MNTDEVITYIIPGCPLPLSRARMGRGRMWDSQKQEKFSFAIHLTNQHENRSLYHGPLHLDISFFMPIPKFVAKKRKYITQSGNYHIGIPDLSNLIKFVEDAATGILFADDSIIASLCVSKKYDTNARTEFTVRELRKDVKKECNHQY